MSETLATVGIVTGAGRGMGLACARRLAALVDTVRMLEGVITAMAGQGRTWFATHAQIADLAGGSPGGSSSGSSSGSS